MRGKITKNEFSFMFITLRFSLSIQAIISISGCIVDQHFYDKFIFLTPLRCKKKSCMRERNESAKLTSKKRSHQKLSSRSPTKIQNYKLAETRKAFLRMTYLFELNCRWRTREQQWEFYTFLTFFISFLESPADNGKKQSNVCTFFWVLYLCGWVQKKVSNV